MSDCAKCDQIHERCKGHARTGKPCRAFPIPGMNVCRLHGGKSPQARAAAARRTVEQRAETALRARWAAAGERTITDPLGELARIAAEVVAFKDYLRGEVTDLEGLITYWQEKDYLDSDGGIEWTKAAEDVRAVVAAYERSLDRAAKVLGNIVKLDLAGRMLAINEQRGILIADAVQHGLAQVDMPAEIRRGAQEAIADAIANLSTTSVQTRELSA